ncbi:Na+/H+ antiporter NhaC [Romboutsia sp.]|uniref:Na+/H+ antiporter NhaC n=1 Tax=Romboutsia sp. TaxID=1965302 RepID=UPI002C463863|nr:Na+/H+ antiporter NhaC [Romboutsia sp.]HSQ89552.1 Na+/H+ antiporter NhaC [Romboutsia sp.]
MKGKEKKQATLFDALIPIVCLILFLGISILKYGASPHVPLMGGAIVAAIVAIFKLGYAWNELEESIFVTIKMAMQAIVIIMIIGVLIGTWIISGIVPAMIYWGLEILSPQIFLIATTIICCIVSIATGSSWTTMGTVGVALLGIGQGLGMPAPLVAGSIISGSYFGDKLSPLSDTTNLAPAMAGNTLFDHIRFMLYSTIPSLIICLILYGILGMKYAGQDLDMSQINLIRDTLVSSFNTLSPVLFIPPMIVIGLVIFKVPAIPGLVAGAVLGFVFAIVFQGASVGDIINAAHSGFVSNSGVAAVDELLSKGGLMSMMSTVSLTICALSLGGILEKTGMLEVLASSILKFAKGTFGVVFATMATCMMTNVVAGEQYLSIVIPGRMYKNEYRKRGLHPKMLSRALEDSGTMSSALVPWNTCGAYIYGTLGVSTFAYFPYAFLNLINPLVSLFLIAIKFKIETLSPEEMAKIENESEDPA